MHTSAGTTYYLYDGGVPVCELNSAGTVTAYNTWGSNGLSTRTSGSSTSYYEFDPRGDTAVIYNASMSQLDDYQYDAYGNQVGGSSAVYAYDGFGSKWGNYHDPGIGWTLMGHRFMAPGQARFINRDPADYWGGFNLYRYAENNPVNEIDPLGLWNLYRWIYTGDGDAPDCVYFAALDVAGESLPTRLPDYVSVNFGYGFQKPLGWLSSKVPFLNKAGIGPAGSLIFDRGGHIYVGPGGALGAGGWGGSVMAGYIDTDTASPPSLSQIYGFITNKGWNYNAGYGLGVGQTWSTIGSSWYHANEFGASSPNIGGGWAYGIPLPIHGYSW